MLRLLLVTVLVLVIHGSASAQAPSEVPAVLAAPAPAPPEHAGRRTGISIEPLYLVIGMVDVTVEQQLVPHVSLAVTGGYGKLLFGQATLWELSLQGNVYLRANATGWHAGAQVRYFGGKLADWLKTEEDRMTGDPLERVLGAYAGYTWVSDRGLTIQSQLGVGQMRMTNTNEGTKREIIPIANFTIGWSF